MGRSGRDVKHLGKLIPGLPIDQSVWKQEVCYWDAKGEPVTVAVQRATAAAREADILRASLRPCHPGVLTRSSRTYEWAVGLRGRGKPSAKPPSGISADDPGREPVHQPPRGVKGCLGFLAIPAGHPDLWEVMV